MKTEYSNECERCGIYNFKPELCLECFRKEVLKEIERIINEFDFYSEGIYKVKKDARILKEELKSKLGLTTK